MKRIYLVSVAIIMAGLSGMAQNAPTIGTPDDDTLFVNSGQNFLLIPDVSDSDAGGQDIAFDVSSSDPSILVINNVEYTAGNTMALIQVTEQGKMGTVTVTIEATDPDGTATADFQVFVGPYNNPGINFEVHDIVFWQQVVPLDANPAFSMVAESGVAPYEQIDLASLNLSVYSDCQTSPPCIGTDFFTGFFKGYVIPPTSGVYLF
jgi:hypothetical protein